MIKVRMRKQNQIDGRELVPLQSGFRQTLWTDGEVKEPNADTREKHGIGKNGDTEKVDQDSGMTEPGGGDADLRGIRDVAAEFAFMIAAREQQGRGLGTKFALMVHACAFGCLGLDRLYASIFPRNLASRRVFEKLGYVLDDSPEARAFAEDAGDVTMVIDRVKFERLHETVLKQFRIAPR